LIWETGFTENSEVFLNLRKNVDYVEVFLAFIGEVAVIVCCFHQPEAMHEIDAAARNSINQSPVKADNAAWASARKVSVNRLGIFVIPWKPENEKHLRLKPQLSMTVSRSSPNRCVLENKSSSRKKTRANDSVSSLVWVEAKHDRCHWCNVTCIWKYNRRT
jgi:hypothetical protein